MAVGVVAMVQREEDLHEIVPNDVLRDGTILLHCLFDDGGQVSTTAVLHKNIEDTSVSINVTVVISYNVVVVQVFEDVSRTCERSWSRRNNKRRVHF